MYRRINKLSTVLQINLNYIINYKIPNIPPWSNNKLSLNTTLASCKKNNTTSTTYKRLFFKIIEEFPSYKHTYTDASKTEKGTGIAIIASNFQQNKKINNHCSIFSAEMLAIYSAIKYIKDSQLPYYNYVIFTDSLSSIKCLSNHRSNNCLKSNIIETINDHPNEIAIV